MRAILIFIISLYSLPLFAIDVSVEDVKLSYLDNITAPNKPVVRFLSSLHDDEYWSKPNQVDAIITVKNNSNETVKSVRIKVELYHSLSHREEQHDFPALPHELKTITDKPVWVWTNNLVNGRIDELKSGESKVLVYKDLKVRDDYYAYDYSFNAFAVKVFADPGNKDENYSNNSNYKVVHYGD